MVRSAPLLGSMVRAGLRRWSSHQVAEPRRSPQMLQDTLTPATPWPDRYSPAEHPLQICLLLASAMIHLVLALCQVLI
jgi:hypothetical protein